MTPCLTAHDSHICSGNACLRSAVAVFERAEADRHARSEVAAWLVWPDMAQWGVAERELVAA